MKTNPKDYYNLSICVEQDGRPARAHTFLMSGKLARIVITSDHEMTGKSISLARPHVIATRERPRSRVKSIFLAIAPEAPRQRVSVKKLQPGDYIRWFGDVERILRITKKGTSFEMLTWNLNRDLLLQHAPHDGASLPLLDRPAHYDKAADRSILARHDRLMRKLAKSNYSEK